MDQKRTQLATIAAIAIAALGGGAATDYAPDPASMAKFGPIAFALVVYLEFRWRPLIVSIARALGAIDMAVEKTTSEQLSKLADELTAKAEAAATSRRKPTTGPIGVAK